MITEPKVRYLGPTRKSSNLKYWIETGEIKNVIAIYNSPSGFKYLLSDEKNEERSFWTDKTNVIFY
jgi:hypothetical protein